MNGGDHITEKLVFSSQQRTFNITTLLFSCRDKNDHNIQASV